jgi:hypothetical protein
LCSPTSLSCGTLLLIFPHWDKKKKTAKTAYSSTLIP